MMYVYEVLNSDCLSLLVELTQTYKRRSGSPDTFFGLDLKCPILH